MKSTKIVEKNENTFVIQFEIPRKSSMLEAEEILQEKLNEVGVIGTGELMKKIDRNAFLSRSEDTNSISKGKIKKTYQTPYGETEIECHIYQNSKDREIFCPLEQDARIIGTSTPKFTKMVISKYSEIGASGASKDLSENHGRTVLCSFIQNLCDELGVVAFEKETEWQYELSQIEEQIDSVFVDLDDTCTIISEENCREAFDKELEKHHTICTGATLELSEERVLTKVDCELEHAKACHNPKNETHSIEQLLHEIENFSESNSLSEKDPKKIDSTITCFSDDKDNHHASEYLANNSEVIFKTKDKYEEKKLWFHRSCDNLKNENHSTDQIFRGIEHFSRNKPLSEENPKKIDGTYFGDDKDNCHASGYLANNLEFIFETKDKYEEKKLWFHQFCHNLKNTDDATRRLIAKMQYFSESNPISDENQKKIRNTISYFNNNKEKMNDEIYVNQNLKIDFGVTENVCKIIKKQKIYGAEMKFEKKEEANVLSLKVISNTKDRQYQFPFDINEYEFLTVAKAA